MVRTGVDRLPGFSAIVGAQDDAVRTARYPARIRPYEADVILAHTVVRGAGDGPLGAQRVDGEGQGQEQECAHVQPVDEARRMSWTMLHKGGIVGGHWWAFLCVRPKHAQRRSLSGAFGSHHVRCINHQGMKEWLAKWGI